MRKAHENSLAGQVRFFSRLIVIILLIPTVISLVVTAAYAVSFHRSVSMMGNVAALRPVVEEIPERLWSVIAGRESFEESGVDDAILQVDRSLDSFLSQMGKTKGPASPWPVVPWIRWRLIRTGSSRRWRMRRFP